ncbi:MAG: M36 family metallopeptidase [Flavobacteriales bacterium]|nr:M36 family metallopeptidase [Flavobacteriales bacterium]
MGHDLGPIAQYGFNADLYNGNGGNNIALQLVIDGMKYTPSSPGFVDARDAILLADQITYGGAHQNLIWTVFAARGLGFSASQGNPYWRFDQVEAFDLPTNNNVGVLSPNTPQAGAFMDCQNGLPVTLKVRNNGLAQQGNFNVGYRLDGGAPITQLFSGTLIPGASAPITFPGMLALGSYGLHTIKTWTSLAQGSIPHGRHADLHHQLADERAADGHRQCGGCTTPAHRLDGREPRWALYMEQRRTFDGCELRSHTRLPHELPKLLRARAR